MHLHLRASRRGWAVPLIVALLLACGVVTWLDKWLWSNEVFNNISMGLSYEPTDEALVGLRSEGFRYCDLYAAPAEDVAACRVYQYVVTDKLFFAHPLASLIGLQLRGLLDRPDWQQGLHWIAVEVPLISAAVGLAIWLFLTLATPREDRSLAAAFTFLLIFIGQSLGKELTPMPDLIRDSGGWAGFGVAAILSLGLLGLTTATARPARFARPAAWALDDRLARRLFWGSLILFAASIALPAELNIVLAPLALVLGLSAAAALGFRSGSASPVVIAAAFVLLFVAITSGELWIGRRLGTSASWATLIYIAVMALVTTKPASRLVWALPLTAMFHLPLAALLGLATVLAETLVAVRVRQASHLLFASLVTFAIGLTGMTMGVRSEGFSPTSVAHSEILQIVLGWPGLIPAILSLALLAIFALLPLRRVDATGIGLARAGLLIVQGVGAALVASSIQQHDATLLNTPGFALFAKSAGYLSPALFTAAIVAIVLLLRRMIQPAAEGAEGTRTLRPVPILLTALVLAFAVAKLDLKARNSYAPAPLNLWRYVVQGKQHPDWCVLKGLSLRDETYYLSTTDPTNDAIIYWSALKARLRADAGLYDPEGFKVLPIATAQCS